MQALDQVWLASL